MPRPFRPRDAKPDPHRDVSDELRFHLDMRAEEFAARGLPPDDARRAAEASFGDVAAVRAECERVRADRERVRRWRAWRWDLRMDARYAIRALRRAPLFTLGAVLTLALGVGAAAAVFTLVNGVLLRPLPYPAADRLAMVWTDPGDGEGTRWPLSAPTYLDVRADTRAFASMAAFRGMRYALGGADDAAPEMVPGARVDPALFATLGVRPALGRGFTPDEAREGAARVVVLSDGLWRRRFGGDPSVIGRSVALSGASYTVVGVMPPGFAFPRGAELPAPLQFGARTEMWTPLAFSERDLAQPAENLSVVARLRAGETLATADAALERTARRLRAESPRSFGAGTGFRAVSVAEQAAAPVRRGLLLLMGAVGFVLLIACANVANLLVARAAHRAREFATRAALGATRGRVFLQLVVENAVLTLAGAALGLAGAATAGRALLRAFPSELPRADDVTVDLTVVGATVLAALAAGVVFAGATAATAGGWRAAAGTIGGRATAGLRRRAGRRILVAAEIALSLVLLTGAGLLARSFARLQAVEPGFDAAGVITAGVMAPNTGGGHDPQRDGPRWRALFAGYAERLAAQPGVVAAGGVSGLPLTGRVEFTGLQLPGRVVAEGEQPPSALFNVVVGAFFEVMRIPLRAGRLFDARDAAGAAPALVASETFVRRYLPGVPREEVVGRQVGLGIAGGQLHTIVGVVADVRQGGLDAAPVPTIYLPMAQSPYPAMSMVVRTAGGDVAAAVPLMRDALAAVDRALALDDVRLLDEVVATSIARQRFALGLTWAFATVALALCAVGLYAVIATSVAQRTRELGVRLALGATPRDVRGLVLREGLRVTAVGVTVGVAGALGASRLLRAQLFEVSALDPVVFAGVTALAVGVALAATWIPARRATSVDPVLAIRGD